MNNTLLLTVNYKNYVLTDNFLEKMTRFKGLDILVIDNESNTQSLEELRNKYVCNTNIVFVGQEKNLGYLQGCHFGLGYVTNLSNYDYIIISNNDIEINDVSFFDKLSSISKKKEDFLGIIAPSIVVPNTGLEQNPFITKYKRWFYYYHHFFYCHFKLYSLRNWLADIKNKVLPKLRIQEQKKEQYIAAPHGSFMILTKFFFQKGGHLNYENLLFGEEEFLANQATRLSLQIIFNPSLKVFHNEHTSTGYNSTFTKYILAKKAFLGNSGILKFYNR